VKVLLLGGSGFIGREIVAVAPSLGWKIAAPSSGQCDLASWPSVAAFMEAFSDSWEALIIAIAPRMIGEMPEHSGADALMAVHTALLARAMNPKKLVFLSSADVYGRPPSETPLREGSALRPDSFYAVTKIFSENLLTRVGRSSGAALTILRPPGVYGINDRSPRIVSALLNSSQGGHRVKIAGDGSQRRDLVWVGDVARIVASAVSGTLPPAVYNVATGMSLSVREIIDNLRVAGWDPHFEFEGDASGQYDMIFATDKLISAFPEFRFTPISSALRRERN